MTVRGRPRPAADEGGQTAVLIIGFALVIAMTVVLVVDATAAYLRRQALSTLADGAALAAADAIAAEQVYTAGLGDRVHIDPGLAAAVVRDHLSATGAAGRYPGLAHSVLTDGDRVVVRVAAPLVLPLPLPGVPSATVVRAEAAARVSLTW